MLVESVSVFSTVIETFAVPATTLTDLSAVFVVFAVFLVSKSSTATE